MSSPHTISKESTTAEIARHGTKRPDGKRKRTPQACANVKKKLPSFLFTTNNIPPDRVQIFDTFLFSGGAFRSSAGCLRPNASSLLLFLPYSFFPSFLLFTTSTMTFGLGARKRASFPVVVQHVLCTTLQSAGARVVSKRYRDALEQGKERVLKLGARYSCCKAEKKSRAS